MEAPHSTTSDATSGAEVWDSGIRGTDATFSHTFSTTGNYPYYCVVHSFPGGTAMNGVVRVVAPVTPTPGPPGAVPALGGPGRLALVGLLAAAGAALIYLSRAR